MITSRDGGEGEYKLRGTARAETDPAVQQHRYAESVANSLGWRPEPGRFHLFAVDIDEITFIRYDDATGRLSALRRLRQIGAIGQRQSFDPRRLATLDARRAASTAA